MRNVLKILYGVGLCMVTSIVVVTRAHTCIVLYVQPCTTLHPYTMMDRKRMILHEPNGTLFAIRSAACKATSLSVDIITVRSKCYAPRQNQGRTRLSGASDRRGKGEKS